MKAVVVSKQVLSNKASIYLAKDVDGNLAPGIFIKEKYRDAGTLKRAAISSSAPVWTFIASKQRGMPLWLQPFMDLTEDHYVFEFGENVSALLFLKVKNHYFCVPYGQGHHLIDKALFEADFGLDLSNLIVDEDQVTAVDWTTLEPEAPRAKKQTMKGNEINFYRLNALSDIVTGLSGKPRDKIFGSKVIGSNTLTIFNKMDVNLLAAICEELLTIKTCANADDIRVWRNGVTPIHDQNLIEELNTAFVAAIIRNSGEGVHFAPPETLALEEIEGFAVSHQKNICEVTATIDFTDYLTMLPSLRSLSWSQLNSDAVLLKNDHHKEPFEKWSVWSCLHGELRYGKTVFIIDSGKWYEVAESIAERINFVIDSIPTRERSLPSSNQNENEFDLNRRMGSLSAGLVSMDRKLVRTGDIHTGVELCDIYTADAELIHVKRGTLSKDFIYLLTQVTSSAKALAGDDLFKAEAMNLVTNAVMGRPDFADMKVPANVSQSIVLGIVTNKPGPWSKILPFMAKLKLVEALTDLKAMRFSVTFAKIEIVKKAESDLSSIAS